MESEDRMNERRSLKCLEHSDANNINYPKTINTVVGVGNVLHNYFLSVYYVTEVDIAPVPLEPSTQQVEKQNRASLVAQWLRIHLSMQGTQGSSPGPGRTHMPHSN